ncbi:MAG: POTRA domain-containing protein [Candidatus Aminicenantales bacterium]
MSRSGKGSKIGRLRLAFPASRLCLILSVLGLLVSAAIPQDTEVPAVAKVEVWVDGSPDTENLDRLISVRPGDRYSLAAVSAAIKQVFQSGLFSDIEVIRSGIERIGLKFVLTRKRIVRKIHFRGEKGVSGQKLRNALYSLHEDGYFSEESLKRATAELNIALNDEGFFQPSIQASVRPIQGVPLIDIAFVIQAGARYSISDIRFERNADIPVDDLKATMKTRVGDFYSLSRLDQDLVRLRELYVERRYPRAEVDLIAEEFFPENGTVFLLIRIDPDERIDIAISGAEISPSLVRPIWEEKIFEDWGLSEGEARILDHLRARGYILATVDSRIERTGRGIRVIYRVDPGQKYKIQDIRFEGNRYFPADDIKKALGIVEGALFFGVLDGKRIYELPAEIKMLYQIQGFPDAQVGFQFFQNGDRAEAVYSIQEGRQQRIETIEIAGAVLVDPETIRAQLNIAEGGPFFRPVIQREVEKLNALYLNKAVRGTRIESQIEAVGDGVFKVVFNIQEGRIVRIQSLLISGNFVTRKKVIQRELRIRAGDLARADQIAASRQNLERLGIFSSVTVEEIPVSDEMEHVVISLREGERNYVGFGIGLETKEPVWSASSLLAADLRLRGTAEYMRSNVFGSAASLSFVTQFSLSEKRAVVIWQQPYFFFDFPIQTSLSAWIESEERQSFAFQREGVSLTGTRPIFWDLDFLATVRYTRTVLEKLEIPPNEIDREFYPYSKTSLAPSFILERRDDAFNPERGAFSSLALEWALPLFQTESDFLKALFKYQRYFSPVSRVLIGSTFRLGLGQGKIPIHERFFAGGSNSFRGAEFDELGPKDLESGVPIGGKALLLFNFEGCFPVVSALRGLSGLVFYDVGNVFSGRNDLDLAGLEHAVGAGLRYRTPLGPARLELGWNLTDPERRKKPIVFITIGNIF